MDARIRLTFLLFTSCVLIVNGYKSATISFNQDTSVTLRNPFRGFMAYSLTTNPNTTSFPTSLEYQYINMSDVNPAQDQYDFSSIEAFANDAVQRGNHFVFRVVVDYPGMGSLVPAYLTQGAAAVTFTSYTSYGGGQSPDYNNTRLITAMTHLIAALGRAYDGDKRIAAIELGLLGFYGEWHTFVDSGNQPPFAPRSVQITILNAWNASFNITPLVNSQDEYQYWSSSDASTSQSGYARYKNIGRFDDNFGVQTYNASNPDDANNFYYRAIAAGDGDSWKYTMRGGEVQPTIQQDQFKNPTPSTVQPFLPAVNAVHTSWLLNDNLFEPASSDPTSSNALAASASMGYNFYLSNLYARSDNTTLYIQATIVNTGVAPFYYPISLYASVDGGAGVIFSGTPNSYGGNSSTVISATVPLSSTSSSSSVLRLWLSSSHALSNNPIFLGNNNMDASGRLNLQLQRDTSSGAVISVNGVTMVDGSAPPVTDTETEGSVASSSTFSSDGRTSATGSQTSVQGGSSSAQRMMVGFSFVMISLVSLS